MSGRFRFAAIVIASAALITSLTQALVVPVLPALPRDLDISASTASWLVTVTVIVGAVANPLPGRLGDQFGRRRLLLVTIAAFAGGSAVCAVTTDSPCCSSAGRSRAAYSAMPALILDNTPPHQAAAASGVNALARNLGSALGSAVFGAFAGATLPTVTRFTCRDVVERGEG